MPNRLANATSPYLLQHQDNPVDWHEWGEEAFAEARERDVPILLSVGYSACHWCHVMAHESFEDAETAGQMNQMFVNVKVDREERPDVDAIYMDAVQTMTGRGGWPMTVWLTPDGRPFYAGTYFPNREMTGMPSFRTVLQAMSDAWFDRRDEVIGQSDRLTEAIARSLPRSETTPDVETLESAYHSILASFDPVEGGFGRAPKFPQQPVLDFLLRARSESWAENADKMIEITLSKMLRGGIHDQLAGGFARYSVDSVWLVPHFEKMLYDNAQLARIYLWAGIELDRPELTDVATKTLDYMSNYLHDEGGGFHSAEDADSEGVEGRFYVWSLDEIEATLDPDDAALASHFFGVTPSGNFEGSNILYRPSDDPWTNRIGEIAKMLLANRDLRPRPGLDDKVVASWNGIAIRAFAEAGAALHEDRYLDTARYAAEFVCHEMLVEGTLHRSWRRGQLGGHGFAEDYASVAQGLLALYQATGEYEWFRFASDLLASLVERFQDPDGGFFDTPVDGERLIKRPKSQTDNPLPSGNAFAAEALLTLSSLTGNTALRELAEQTIASAGLLMDRYPSMVAGHLAVLHSMANSRELAIVGPNWADLSSVYWERYRPNIVLAGSIDGSEPVPLLESRTGAGGAQAYVCRQHVCDLPTSDPGALAVQLA